MKRHIVPTQSERVMGDDDFIVSKTDTRGIITYGNRIFIEMSKYDEKELLGIQHNIIRHPDMPRTVFKLLWDTISQGNEIFAFVKNLAKDGSFYWVFANVTPSFDEKGKIIGYFSVRRKPNRDAIRVIEQVYQQVLTVEKNAGAKGAIEMGTKAVVDFLESKATTYDKLVIDLQGMNK